MKPLTRMFAAARIIAAKKNARKAGEKLWNWQSSPVYNPNSTAFRKAEKAVEALPKSLQRIAIEEMNRLECQYHRERVTGRDGRRYSAYDMDQAMMGYSI